MKNLLLFFLLAVTISAIVAKPLKLSKVAKEKIAQQLRDLEGEDDNNGDDNGDWGEEESDVVAFLVVAEPNGYAFDVNVLAAPAYEDDEDYDYEYDEEKKVANNKRDLEDEDDDEDEDEENHDDEDGGFDLGDDEAPWDDEEESDVVAFLVVAEPNGYAFDVNVLAAPAYDEYEEYEYDGEPTVGDY